MKPFITLTAIAVPFDTLNMDTDQILPARYLRKPRGPDYHSYLFHDLRFTSDGAERPDFILNQPAYRDAGIIVGNRNFGCGSSREAAVFALDANDIRAVIAPSFGDIFHNNCFKNGVLPIRLDDEICAGLRAQLHETPGAQITVNLEIRRIIGPDNTSFDLEISEFRRRCLMEGLDDIGLTLEHQAAMESFEADYRREMSWLYPAGNDG
ncbi:MAG: 3-isopropylmalate dehydratase small subunit [Rhodospirillales bacterium]|nr:3-isopropylmalate dehydratase small subunit [Rhodospirillales bacterium]